VLEEVLEDEELLEEVLEEVLEEDELTEELEELSGSGLSPNKLICGNKVVGVPDGAHLHDNV